jgi:hypothetical protein
MAIASAHNGSNFRPTFLPYDVVMMVDVAMALRPHVSGTSPGIIISFRPKKPQASSE